MEENNILRYQKFWQDHSLFCLGPIPKELAKYFNEESKYCVYLIQILSYEPTIVHGIDTVNAIVDRMLDAGIKIINQDDIDRRKDLSRLWGDRKHEFVLEPKGIHQKYDHDYIIHHKPTKRGVLTPTSNEERYDIIKKMIEAGVKIIPRSSRKSE